ncbi:hypothetical protein [Streptococcus sp. CSL10205-OR2]|uniref:hypothetical protein n=1 Tax=Streptococcus sp. CSL10205-OR2 TaxID=2980558 RepID=UPI0021D7F194|nr:hypothetical protein [Streptococcus sp. CSL10205-OR2]MCU9534388.1 hypothetical protein [Streptococcus sp. CSL10205-OR2]
MSHQDYIEQGLNGIAPLKLILCGEVDENETEKVGVVSVVFATKDKKRAKEKLEELSTSHPEKYYMVYSVPLDSDLTMLNHYPSIAISKTDLS